MLYWMCEKLNCPPTVPQLEHAIRRNFGGMEANDKFDPLEEFWSRIHVDARTMPDLTDIPPEVNVFSWNGWRFTCCCSNIPILSSCSFIPSSIQIAANLGWSKLASWPKKPHGMGECCTRIVGLPSYTLYHIWSLICSSEKIATCCFWQKIMQPLRSWGTTLMMW